LTELWDMVLAIVVCSVWICLCRLMERLPVGWRNHAAHHLPRLSSR